MPSWQRRIVDLPDVESFTDLSVGDQFAYDVREVVACPNCARPGLRFSTETAKGIVHSRAKDTGHLHDYCVEAEFLATAPSLLVFDVHGNLVAKEHPTSHKVEGSN